MAQDAEQEESFFKRWFGQEHNPERKRLVQRSSGCIGLALAVSMALRAGLGDLGPVAWAIAGVVFLVFFIASIVFLRRALREPHWGKPQGSD